MEHSFRRVNDRHAKHRQGSRFRNPHSPNILRRLHHIALWQMGCYDNDPPLPNVPQDFAYPNPIEEVDSNQPCVTWINHSTFLIEIDGVSILTDPVWSHRVSPIDFIGPSRLHETPLAISQLERIDYVLISHNHYDHLDEATVRELHQRFPNIQWLVPLGLAAWFWKRGIQRVIQLDWWEVERITRSDVELEFFAVPAQHYSGRTLFDHNKTLWAGWVVRITRQDNSSKSFYFVGDTGYNDVHFREIGDLFEGIDLSLIPIGVYRPRTFMRPVHANPADAAEIHQDVGSRLSVGTHWNTFRLSSEPRHQPPYDLFLELQERNLPHESFRVLNPGQTINW